MPSKFRFQANLDGCPMFAPAYMGRKRFFSNAFAPYVTNCTRSRALEGGCAPSFSAHVR